MHNPIIEVAFNKAELNNACERIINNACERGEVDYYRTEESWLSDLKDYFHKQGLTLNEKLRTLTVTDKYDLEDVFDKWRDDLKELLDHRACDTDFWEIQRAVKPYGEIKFVYNDELIDEIEFIIELCKCEQGTKVYIGQVFDCHY